MSAIIPISRGLHVKVDEEDLDFLNQWRWTANPAGRFFYAIRRSRKLGVSAIFMHRELMECPEEMTVDHIDGDPLNNQKSNLRVCSFAENRMNLSMNPRNTSGFKGVFFAGPPHSRWRATIGLNGKRIYLGQFLDPIIAAEKYDEAAVKFFGPFAKTNKQLGLL